MSSRMFGSAPASSNCRAYARPVGRLAGAQRVQGMGRENADAHQCQKRNYDIHDATCFLCWRQHKGRSVSGVFRPVRKRVSSEPGFGPGGKPWRAGQNETGNPLCHCCAHRFLELPARRGLLCARVGAHRERMRAAGLKTRRIWFEERVDRRHPGVHSSVRRPFTTL